MIQSYKKAKYCRRFKSIPFRYGTKVDEKTGEERSMTEQDYDGIILPRGPIFNSVILMAFERALECGGWRGAMFAEWFRKYIDDMDIELATKIYGKLKHYCESNSGERVDKYHKNNLCVNTDRSMWAPLLHHLSVKLRGK